MKVRGKFPEAKPTPHHPDEVGPGALTLPAERITEAVSGYRGSEYVSDDLLDLIDHTMQLVAKHAEKFAAQAAAYDLPDEQAKMRLDEGFHLLDADKLKIDNEALQGVTTDILALASFTDEETLAAMRDYIDKLIADPQALTTFIRFNVARHEANVDEQLEASGLSREAFYFLLYNLGVAVLPAYAAYLGKQVDDERWLNGTCPICGNRPAMAALVGDGGKRHLFCGTCNFVWTYPRLKCPYCGNKEHEKMMVLMPSDDSPYQLDACQACSRYVKTVDYRKADAKRAVLLPVEDAATVYLDIMAGNEGFKRE